MAYSESQRFLETTTQTVSWFSGRLRDDELMLRPVFQRNPVWTAPQKSYLIDSMLRGYPVPELYLQLQTDDQGRDVHVVVDGQQRIRACLEFLEGVFALGDEAGDWSGSYFHELPGPMQKAIRQYKFAVRVLPEMDEQLIREIFGRLNRNNMALNKQELRNATYWGRFIVTMKDLADDGFWLESGLFTANELRRMLDVEYVSELAVAVLYGPQNKKATLDQYYEDFEEEFPAEAAIRERFQRVLPELRHLVDWGEVTRWSKKSDFYTLFLYVASKDAELPFSSDRRQALRIALADFSGHVDAFLLEDLEEVAVTVKDYARAVQRAASDLQSRRTRQAALQAYLDGTPYVRATSGRGEPMSRQLQALDLKVDDTAVGADDDE